MRGALYKDDPRKPRDEVPGVGGGFEGKAHRLRVRVYYEDTDFSGIVYHATYLRYAERGRSEFLRASGASNRDLFEGKGEGKGREKAEGEGKGEAGVEAPPRVFALTGMEMDFVRAARIDDELDVMTTLEEMRGIRWRFEQRIWRGEEEVWRGQAYATTLDPRTGRPARLGVVAKERLLRWLERVNEGS